MMTAALDAFAARLDQVAADPLAEPLGWQCRRCGGRATAPDAPTDPVSLDLVLDLLGDSATAHARSCDR